MPPFASLPVIGLVFAIFGAPGAGAIVASQAFGVSVVVDGVALAQYPCRSLTYVEATEGRSFSLRVTNPTGQRVAVALSVDGRNVIDARRTSALAATKWILAPGQTIEVPGWQISSETSRRFFFTQTRSSYARWLGDTSNVGVIEAVFFRERPSPPIVPSFDAEPPSSDEGAGGGSTPWEGAPKLRRNSPAPSGALAERDRSDRAEDSLAATGIGDRTPFSVRRIGFEEEPTPVARVALRYEFRRELVKLGVLRSDGDPSGRDLARGFDPEYAPDPYRSRAQ